MDRRPVAARVSARREQGGKIAGERGIQSLIWQQPIPDRAIDRHHRGLAGAPILRATSSAVPTARRQPPPACVRCRAAGDW